jgi:hypothetical protein
MKQVEKTLPQWKAPDTLLFRVVNELDKKTSLVGFYSWAVVYRYIFCIASVAMACIVCLITYGVGCGWDDLMIVNIATTKVAIWYDCLLTIQTILYDLILRFLRQPAILLFTFVFAIIIIITWTGSVAALYQMLSANHRRKYI